MNSGENMHQMPQEFKCYAVVKRRARDLLVVTELRADEGSSQELQPEHWGCGQLIP
jgi:hypothetical protein